MRLVTHIKAEAAVTVLNAWSNTGPRPAVSAAVRVVAPSGFMYIPLFEQANKLSYLTFAVYGDYTTQRFGARVGLCIRSLRLTDGVGGSQWWCWHDHAIKTDCIQYSRGLVTPRAYEVPM